MNVQHIQTGDLVRIQTLSYDNELARVTECGKAVATVALVNDAWPVEAGFELTRLVSDLTLVDEPVSMGHWDGLGLVEGCKGYGCTITHESESPQYTIPSRPANV